MADRPEPAGQAGEVAVDASMRPLPEPCSPLATRIGYGPRAEVRRAGLREVCVLAHASVSRRSQRCADPFECPRTTATSSSPPATAGCWHSIFPPPSRDGCRTLTSTCHERRICHTHAAHRPQRGDPRGAAADPTQPHLTYPEGWEGTPIQLLAEVSQRTPESTRKARSWPVTAPPEIVCSGIAHKV